MCEHEHEGVVEANESFPDAEFAFGIKLDIGEEGAPHAWCNVDNSEEAEVTDVEELADFGNEGTDLDTVFIGVGFDKGVAVGAEGGCR